MMVSLLLLGDVEDRRFKKEKKRSSLCVRYNRARFLRRRRFYARLLSKQNDVLLNDTM